MLKRVLLTLALLLGLVLPADAADIILSFRASSGYVTDAVGTYVLASDTYPTTRGGFTFGWATCTAGLERDNADRDSGVSDKRFAGINYVVANNMCVFRVLLPATGSYDVRFALGDAGFDQSGSRQVVEVLDNVTSKFTVDTGLGVGPAEDHFFDATGVDLTMAAWPGSNAASTQTFASTTFNFNVGSVALSGGATVLAHLQITTAAGGGGGSTTIRHRVVQ